MESNLDRIDRIIEGRINRNNSAKTNIKNSIATILSVLYQTHRIHMYTIQHNKWGNVPHTTLTIGSLAPSSLLGSKGKYY